MECIKDINDLMERKKDFNDLKTDTTYVVDGYTIHYSLSVRKEGSDKSFQMEATGNLPVGLLAEYIKDTNPSDKFTFVVKDDKFFKYPVIDDKTYEIWTNNMLADIKYPNGKFSFVAKERNNDEWLFPQVFGYREPRYGVYKKLN